MRGCVTRKPKDSGPWYAVVDLGKDPETGKRRRRWSQGYKTKREAQAALNTTLGDLQRGTYVEPSKQTLGDFLEKKWLAAIRSTVRPSTFDSYRSNVQAHVIPRLGLIPLVQLGPERLNAFYADLLESGRVDRSGGLSPKTVRYIHTILHRALRDAVKWGRLSRNVAAFADPPKLQRPEMQVWSGESIRAFLAHVRDDRLFAAYLLAATTGMRRGEILGARWSDLDLDSGRLAIRQTLITIDYEIRFSEPKTGKGKRSVALDPATIAGLRAHRSRQMQERLAWGEGYVDSGLIFTRENGEPIHPQSLSQTFERHVRAAGLPKIRFHDLRHSYATVALSGGAHPKVVSERLGHANVTITLDTYSHVIPALAEQEASRIAALILGP